MQVALSIVKHFSMKSNRLLLLNYLTKVRKFSIGNVCLAKHPHKHFKYYISPVIEEDIKIQDLIDEEREKKVSSKRNKSGLHSKHFRMEHNKMPDLTEDELEITDLRSYRKYFGRYGMSSNVDLKALWPSTFELKLLKERERIEFPHSVQEMIAMAKEARLKEEQEIMERQEELVENMKKLDKWKKDLRARVEKREMEAKLLLEKKEKQIEDVREMLGYNISPHDPKFQEILDKKIEEDRKRAKKEKKLRKQQIELERLTEMTKKEAMDAQMSHSDPNTKE